MTEIVKLKNCKEMLGSVLRILSKFQLNVQNYYLNRKCLNKKSEFFIKMKNLKWFLVLSSINIL